MTTSGEPGIQQPAALLHGDTVSTDAWSPARGWSPRPDLFPADIDARRRLEFLADERFCTAVCAHLRVDTEPARMVIASGGHPPALIRRGDGAVEQIPGDGLLLGLFADPRVTEAEVDLQPGDLVLVYSDGLTEARRGQQLFGVEGLAAAVGSAARLSAEALVAHVHAAAERWQDSQRDDMAALAVEFQP